MKPARFDYLLAESMDEALEALARAGDAARVIAGGQSLMALLNMRLTRPEMLVDITRIPGLGEIRRQGQYVEIGAAVTQATLLDWPDLASSLPLLHRALPHVGHIQTRNRGTICGSICHADPSSEIPLVLATLEGEVVLQSKAGRRVLKASEFQVGMLTTARRADEVVVAARFPTRRPGAGYAFTEFNRRHGDFAIVALAAVADASSVRLGVGGVADVPTCRELAALSGSALDEALNAFASGAQGHRGGAAMPLLTRDKRHPVTITLNGEDASGFADARTLLVDFIRHEIGATGTHVGCEHGVCGACNVMVDGKVVRACLMLAVQADGKRVDTVESLAEANGGALNPLQEAFHRNFALQCGFCTPGMLMTLTELERRGGSYTEEQIREALSGNLCRCTGYTEIVRAALEVLGTAAKRDMKEAL
jgi:2-furoyl-CoA dehydrogenase FAD binding subunit